VDPKISDNKNRNFINKHIVILQIQFA
jgi:hypothetical protein